MLASCVDRALDFIAARQLPSGEIPVRYWLADGDTTGWFDSTPFPTAHAAYSLSFVRDARAEAMIARALPFLREEMDGPGYWRWRTRANPIRDAWAPDVDDTSCVSFVLRQHRIPFPENRRLLLGNRTDEGLFYTWLVPRRRTPWGLNLVRLGLAHARVDRARIHVHHYGPLQRDNVEVVVNANALWYLGECAETGAATDYVLEAARGRHEAEWFRFYVHRFSFYYVLSRAYWCGVSRLGAARDDVVAGILGEWRAEGGFANELETALGLAALLNFGCRLPEMKHAAQALCQRQEASGGWRQLPWIGWTQVAERWGSAEMTTAFCVEALARYAEAEAR